jgi:hypothetical protein
MTNPFKPNSRFDCLIDTSFNNKVSSNSKSYSPHKGHYNNKAFNSPIFKTNKVFVFNASLFPALSDNTIKTNDIKTNDIKTNDIKTNDIKTDGVSYLDKITVVQKETGPIGPKLDYGWCSIELDRHTNTSIFTNCIPSPDIIPFDGETVIDNLNNKYLTFVENYIELWGEDEYINMFMFPNYDYDYFEKLDEEYEEYMEDIYKQDTYNYQNETYFEAQYN